MAQDDGELIVRDAYERWFRRRVPKDLVTKQQPAPWPTPLHAHPLWNGHSPAPELLGSTMLPPPDPAKGWEVLPMDALAGATQSANGVDSFASSAASVAWYKNNSLGQGAGLAQVCVCVCV